MIEVEMGNVVSKFHNIDNDTIDYILADKLSYKSGGWGEQETTKFLYSPRNKITYTGLVPHAIRFFNEYGIKYKIIDKRKKTNKNANFSIMQQFSARDYQSEIINNASSREIIQAATGAGKTFIMASLITKFNVKPVLVIAPKVSLALQIKEEFEKFLGVHVGIVGGGYNQVEDITICTPQSANNNIIKSVNALFFDECHFLPAKTIFDIACKAVNAYYRIGVSATPWRDGGDDLLIEAALNIRKPHLSINASKLISKEKLSPCEIKFININSNVGWLGDYHLTYNNAIIHNINRNNTIVKLTKLSLDNRKAVLILISKIKHGNLLLKKLKSEMAYEEKAYVFNNKYYTIGTVEFVSGVDDIDRRQAVFEAIKDGFCKVLIGSTIADEGLDLPILDTLILAGAGKSSTRAFQRIGRVLRLYKDKDNAIVYDFIDSNPTFYKQSMYRKALYETEPLWKINFIQNI